MTMANSSATNEIPETDDTTVQKITCSSCAEECNDAVFYRCSCVEVDPGDLEARYCDSCITPHIKKEHNVLDCQGYQPAICSAHKVLSMLFCEDCKVILCFKCLADHTRHDVDDVSKKAREMRKTVFEYLNKFDEFSKPLAARKCFMDRAISLNANFYPCLSNENLVDKMCSHFESLVRSKASKLDQIIAESNPTYKVYDMNKRTDSEVSNLRSMLLMFDRVFISSVLESKDRVDSLLEELKNELGSGTVCKWKKSSDFVMEKFVEEILDSWKQPFIDRFQVTSLNICTTKSNSSNLGPIKNYDSHTLYDVSISENQNTVSFFYMAVEDDYQSELFTKYSVIPKFCDVRIGNVKEVFRDGDMAGFLSCSEDKLHIFDLNGNFWYFTIRMAKHRKLLRFDCSYSKQIEGFSYDQPGKLKPKDFTFICWNLDSKFIECIIEGAVSWRIPCKTKPKLFYWRRFQIWTLEEENNKLTLFNTRDPTLKLEILPEHHGMNCIDNIHTGTESLNGKPSSEWVYLFDFRAKIVLIATFSVKNYSDLKFEVTKMYTVCIDGDISFMDIRSRDNCGLYLVVLQKLDILTETLETSKFYGRESIQFAC